MHFRPFQIIIKSNHLLRKMFNSERQAPMSEQTEKVNHAPKVRRTLSLRAKVTMWLAGILLVVLLSLGIAAAMGQYTSSAFDTLLADNAACYRVQDAIKGETRAFARYVREGSQDSLADYQNACAETEESLAALPFDYAQLGEDRYARTWNLLQGYQGYKEQREAFAALTAGDADYVEQTYQIMARQDDLAEYALRLTQATLEQENTVYSQQTQRLDRLPWLYLVMLAAAAVSVLLILRQLSVSVAKPLLQLTQASRSIAAGQLDSPDLPAASDEVGQLTGTFNQMKHAMAESMAAREALHREEVRNLALEKDLEHTRLEVLKSQVNPHFLFNTLNMISCMARLEDAADTDQMIVRLGSLFRHNLRTKKQVIPLEEELEGLDDYIYLQQMRFDGRITVEKQIEVDPAAVTLPSFTLQPILENAFSHGLKSCEEGGLVLLKVWQEGGTLILTVSDNGKGMTEEELAALQEKIRQSEQTGKSIGLGNISRRISMLYPTGGMSITSRAGQGTTIRFDIPQKTEQEESEHEV